MTLIEQYEKARDGRGLTVAEFEEELGLKPYSVFPEAKNAKPDDIGAFMYHRDPRAAGKKGFNGGFPSKEGVKARLPKGIFHPRLGGEQKKRGGFGWKKQKAFTCPREIRTITSSPE
jgi:hypothetical protein